MFNELLRLHKMGFALHWLNKKSKAPVEKNWSSGDRLDFEQLKLKYKTGYNVGVRPGLASKLAEGYYLGIIDCDVKSEDSTHIKEMEKALESVCPDYYMSPQVQSGRNKSSRHIYVKVHELNICQKFQIAESHHKVKHIAPSKPISKHEREILSAKELEDGWRLSKAWELTFMCDGAQVVLPPSIHPDSGRPYAWAIEPKSYEDFIEFKPMKTKPSLTTHSKLDFTLLDDVPVFELGLSERIQELIYKAQDTLDKYNYDRSAMIMACINAMVALNLSNQVIVSVLTDPEFAISEKALEKGSREAGARWVLSQVDKARVELNPANNFDGFTVLDSTLTEEEAQRQNEDAFDWELRLDRNKKDDRPKNTHSNCMLIFSNALEDGTLMTNEFTGSVIYGQKPPWALPGRAYIGQEVSNIDITYARQWLSRRWHIELGTSNMWEILQAVGHKFGFHPVREYLNQLTWDGIKRIDTWLVDYLGALGDADYLQAVGSKTLIAAVARVMVPGIKFDNVLTLEGGQAIGKSMAVDILGGEWASDTHVDPTNKDTINNLRGKWIVELAEMVPAHRVEAESLKAFLTRRVDRARLAFERKAENYPRQCVFIGSTNQSDYLQDETGNRRFWPVKVTALDRDKLITDRDQLWAEALVRYKTGEKLWIDNTMVEAVAKREQAARLASDEWANDVVEYLQKHESKEFHLLKDIWAYIGGVDGVQLGTRGFTQADQKRISRILKSLNFDRILKWIDGRPVRVWVKEKGVEGHEW